MINISKNLAFFRSFEKNQELPYYIIEKNIKIYETSCARKEEILTSKR